MSLACRTSLVTLRACLREELWATSSLKSLPASRSYSTSQPSDPYNGLSSSDTPDPNPSQLAANGALNQESLANLLEHLSPAVASPAPRAPVPSVPQTESRRANKTKRLQANLAKLLELSKGSQPDAQSSRSVKQGVDLIRIGRQSARERRTRNPNVQESAANLFHPAETAPGQQGGAIQERSLYSTPSLVGNDPPSYTRRIEGFLKPLADNFQLEDLAPPTEQQPIARLSHGLDRVLFNPGVYWLQDPRSRVYNFSPWLQTIPKVQDFAFNRVQSFIPSSKDDDLQVLAKRIHARYTGSTSSLTGMLSQIYLMLSCERRVDLSTLSAAFRKEPSTFTEGQKFPVATKMVYKDGVYSMESHSNTPGLSERNVLTWMGTMLEKFLTLPEDRFKLLLHSSEAPPTAPSTSRDAFRFAKIGSFVMRSQLDCYDSRLPGTGVFDIKTRAAMPIRVDIMNWEENSSYYIHQLHGRVESFEREYYDLIRAAFLKYSFQARIGNMDGVMVAYHNTARIFGFQYIPLEEMDERLYGNKYAGPLIFNRCVEMLQVISDEIIQQFPEQSIRCLWDVRPESGSLNVWVQPHEWIGLGERPIVELQVSASNYLDDKFTWGTMIADHIPEKAWSTRYSIATSSSSQAEIRERYQAAVKKQKSIFDLPTGVDVNEMEELWDQMDFGGDDTPSVGFKPEMFREPSAMTMRARALARRGKERMESLQQEMIGKPVIVYGEENNS